MAFEQKPTARRENIVIQETGDELLIYDLKINKIHCLNQTTAIVWNNCDGKLSVAEIARNQKLSVDYVELTIDELQKANLMTTTTVLENSARRKLLKNMAIAGVTLPVIAALVAPLASNAQSNTCIGPNTQSCSVGVGACSRTGQQVRTCVNGVWSDWSPCNVVPGAPSTEICDGIDNDCDGQIDEGCPFP